MGEANTKLAQEPFVEAAAYLLRETFEGSPEGVPSAYLDRGIGFAKQIAPGGAGVRRVRDVIGIPDRILRLRRYVRESRDSDQRDCAK